MARRVLLQGLSLVLFLCSMPALAADIPAVSFLKEIIAREFDGDVMARRNKVYYTDGKGAVVGSCDCSEPRESWYFDDELVVVTSWNIEGTKDVSPDKKDVQVRFHVIATRKLPAQSSYVIKNITQTQVPEKSFDEDVTYRVALRNGHWLLANPPLPRVKSAPVLARLNENVVQELQLRDRATNEGNLKVAKMRAVFAANEQLQIAELEYAALQ